MSRSRFERVSLTLKALTQLPPKQTTQYLLYRLQLQSGWLRWRTTSPPITDTPLSLAVFDLPPRNTFTRILTPTGRVQVLEEADQICAGQVRLFGGEWVPLNLIPPAPQLHWTVHERNHTGLAPQEDIKLVWEPARFGWACTLARAYMLTGEENYARKFWRYSEEFLAANPPYYGWNWTSAQEAALRLIALTYAAHLFAGSTESTPARLAQLARTLEAHAARIPPTISYARAQNNNHLLSEAVGLYTAGCLLPEHPSAANWRELGWKWFHHGIANQITPQGVYLQHSSNYQRLMLQLALWMQLVAKSQGRTFPRQSQDRLAAAVGWLLAVTDSHHGQVPNLGPNDGAYLLPLTVQPHDDYRPVLQAAARVFRAETAFEPGPWDELSLWFTRAEWPQKAPAERAAKTNPVVIQSSDGLSWAYLRAAKFSSRPGHADQLHLDLWWQGYNLAQDAGTYRYNGPTPWQNALVHTSVHNTVNLNDRDQMTSTGRFLFLDWAQAEVLAQTSRSATAAHNGYRKLNVKHQRQVAYEAEQLWSVVDLITPLGSSAPKEINARLHWLLPDWPWRLIPDPDTYAIHFELDSPGGVIKLQLNTQQSVFAESHQKTGLPFEPALFRAGKCLYGTQSAAELQGWSSPTYNLRLPALSLSLTVVAFPPFSLQTLWHLPQEDKRP